MDSNSGGIVIRPNRVKELRIRFHDPCDHKNRISVRRLAAVAGISKSVFSDIENHLQTISPENEKKLVRVFGLKSVDELYKEE